ncbi:MAG: hypothetical protein ACE15F_11975 [bacterium]
MPTRFLLVFGIALLVIYGCSTTGKKPETATAGHPQFETLCSKCHTLDRVTQAHETLSKEQMRALVERMAKKPDSGIDMNNINDIVREFY